MLTLLIGFLVRLEQADAGSLTQNGSPAVESIDTSASPPAGAPDYDTALALAYRWQQPIEVLGAHDSTTREWAMPDGSIEAKVNLGVEYVKDPLRGTWSTIDLALVRQEDGSIRPRTDARNLILSGGASGADENVVARVGSGAQEISIGWLDALPVPVLQDNVARYVNVRPGVDLIVEALATGFEFSIQVKTREAAQALGSVRLPWRVGELKPVKDFETGSIQLLAPSGEVEGELPTAEVYDAQTSPDSGEPARMGAMPMSLETTSGTDYLVIAPNETFINDPATVYPITLDPPVTLRPAFDAFVATNYGSDQSGSMDLKLGRVVDNGQTITARSFMRFDGLRRYQGADVLSAELFLWNYHSWSWSCRPRSWVAHVVSVDRLNSRLRWNNQPSPGSHIGTSSGTKGDEPECNAGWVSVPVQRGFQQSFDNGWSSLGIRLAADDEGDATSWKRFNSSQAKNNRPYVSLKYNRKPGTPGSLKITDCYKACSSPALVRDHRPTLSAKVADPDGGTVKATYEVWTSSGSTPRATSGNALTGIRSGTARSWTTPNLPDGAYRWRARACDYTTACGAWSAWFSFTIDTTNPTLPLISSAVYPDHMSGVWGGGRGQVAYFFFGPNGTRDVTEYKYSLNEGGYVSAPTGLQAERLTGEQRAFTDLGDNFRTYQATMAADTTRNQGGTSASSLRITPAATGSDPAGDSGVSLIEQGCSTLCQGMTPGKRYMATGWIYVPAATGLTPAHPTRGLRIVGFYKLPNETSYREVESAAPTAVDQWQQLHVTMSLPTETTNAFFRVYNGMDYGSGKAVYWDNLSVIEAKIVPITPPRDGLNVLKVLSLDKAGNLSDSRVYKFLVKSVYDKWEWAFDEGSGTVAASTPHNTRPMTIRGTGVTWTEPQVGDAAIAMTGSGELTSASPVLNTATVDGFSVMAWARVGDLTSRRTMVSQDGANGSMFRLEYRPDLDVDGDRVADRAWCFSARVSDTAGAAERRACTKEFVVPDDYVALAGVYDTSAGTMTLYVNGTPEEDGAQAETAIPKEPSWPATGPMAIGRALSGAAAADRWVGGLDEVGAYQWALVPSEVNFYVSRGPQGAGR
ncbi:MAG TPA: DNRLRE domain-containing protein [Nonomuraea sp.]|nr:DNRLRE domain-containing protein [Nonomuraea sp.]